MGGGQPQPECSYPPGAAHVFRGEPCQAVLHVVTSLVIQGSCHPVWEKRDGSMGRGTRRTKSKAAGEVGWEGDKLHHCGPMSTTARSVSTYGAEGCPQAEGQPWVDTLRLTGTRQREYCSVRVLSWHRGKTAEAARKPRAGHRARGRAVWAAGASAQAHWPRVGPVLPRRLPAHPTASVSSSAHWGCSSLFL